jgi:hypothetical protein
VDDGREIALFGYSISSQETWLIHPPNGSKTPGNVIRFSPHQSSAVLQPGRREFNETIGVEFSAPYFFQAWPGSSVQPVHEVDQSPLQGERVALCGRLE